MCPNDSFNELVASAQDGDPCAQFHVGEYYRSQGGGLVDVAARWFEMAAIQNYAEAQLALGLLYLEWSPDEDYREKAMYWMERAAQNGCGAALKIIHELGSTHDYMDSCDLLAAVEENDPQAQFELGYMLLFGLDRPKNESDGLSLLLKAAIAGHPQAQVQIASHYLFDESGPTNGYEAFKWLSLSAKQTEPHALYLLGYAYYHGIGIVKNDEQAASCLLRSAQLGNREAQFQLGQFYHQGVIVAENQEQAQSWLQAAALQGHRDAKDMLEYLLQSEN
jgi:TPR repeat protein